MSIRSWSIAVVLAAFSLASVPAAAEVDLGPDPEGTNRPDSAKPTLPSKTPNGAPHGQNPNAGADAPRSEPADKGPPGLMGLPWPKTPEEAQSTLQSLYALLATSDDHRKAGEIGGIIEQLWRYEGSDTVNLLIDRGEGFSQRMETDKALKLMDAAVDLAPDFAEAWSHRAYVRYRLNDYAGALGDLRRALALEPNHFRALDGMAKILDLIGEKKAALKAYRQLLAIHPNIEGGKEAAEQLKKEVEGQGI